MAGPAIFNGNFVKLLKNALRLGTLSADPSGAQSGDVYFNSVSSTLKFYNGSTWLTAADTSSNSPSSLDDLQNLSVTATVAANALTVSLKTSAGTDGSTGSPIKIGFRSSTLTSGVYNTRSVTSALSMTVSSGSTLGTISATSSSIYVYAIDNAGTVELAVSQSFFPEYSLQSTTAEGGAGAADSSTILYSTTARTSVPVRLIGKIISTQATAGTWATAPSNIVSGASSIVLNRTIAMRYFASSTALSGVTVITYSTKDYDTDNMYASGSIVIPERGLYQANANLSVGATYAANQNTTLFLYVNGTAKTSQATHIGSASQTTIHAKLSDTVYLNAGDTVNIRASSNGTSPSINASNTDNFFSLTRVGI